MTEEEAPWGDAIARFVAEAGAAVEAGRCKSVQITDGKLIERDGSCVRVTRLDDGKVVAEVGYPAKKVKLSCVNGRIVLLVE